jgi:molybdate transport system regulatory protein
MPTRKTRKQPALPRGLKARSKVWLELDGQAVFGDGKARMLEAVERTGSLTAAAESLGMSFRGFWGRLREMEQRLGVKVVERRHGGRGGGGAHLTAAGEALLGIYRRFRRGINAMVDGRLERAMARFKRPRG